MGHCCGRIYIKIQEQEKRHYVQTDYGDLKLSEEKVRIISPHQGNAETTNYARRQVWGYKYCEPIILFRSRARGDTESTTVTVDGSPAGEPCTLVALVGVVGTLAFGEAHLFAVVAFGEGYRPASAPASAPAPLGLEPALASAADTCTPFVVRRRFALGGWRVLPDRT